jgi:hypothetical protein
MPTADVVSPTAVTVVVSGVTGGVAAVQVLSAVAKRSVVAMALLRMAERTAVQVVSAAAAWGLVVRAMGAIKAPVTAAAPLP